MHTLLPKCIRYYKVILKNICAIMNNKIKLRIEQFLAMLTLGKRKNSMAMAIAASLLIILAGSCKSNDKPVQQMATLQQADSSLIIRDSLQAQYNAAHNQLDVMNSQNAALDSQIRNKDAQIAKLEKKVAYLSKSNKSLLAQVKKDKKFINSLKDELSDKARGFAEKLGLLQNERDALASAKDDLLARYNKLKELGSVLHASNIRLTAIHLKHHGTKEKKTRRAHRVDELKVDFDIDENRIADDGTKNLYIVIKDPAGTVLRNVASGTLTKSDGSGMGYSIEAQVPLKQNEPVKDVVVEWKKDTDYKKGLYDITIYNGAYKIGEGEVALK